MPNPAAASTEQTVTLYAHDGELGDNPHALVLELSLADVERFEEATEKRRIPRNGLGPFVAVTDLTTGARYEIASAPCGSGCHCAALARRLP